MTVERIGLLGFGEVGRALADEWAGSTSLSAHDPKFIDPASAPARGLADRPSVAGFTEPGEATEDVDVVVSAVTASEALTAAAQVVGHLRPGVWFVDVNSVSPATTVETAGRVEAGGGRFVEAVVMSSIEPRRLAAPILLGGPHAEEFGEVAAGIGLSGAKAYSSELGRASAVKMCRSVVVKGMEALLAESLVAARHFGVEGDVLSSLENILPLDDWPGKARYLVSRSLLHGARRAEEMREVARTVSEAAVTPVMSEATVARQELAARHADLVDADLSAMLDGLLSGGRA